MRGSILAEPGGAAHAAPRQAARSNRRRLRSAAGLVLTLVAVVATWALLAPPQLGGSTSFVVVDGTSMLPRLHGSDLVALRPASRLQVGDVVAYRSRLLGRIVLHRISAIDGDRYILKGDNNSFLDPDRPTRSEVVGKLWFRVPSAGRAIGWLHIPWVIAALAASLVLVLGLDGSVRRSRSPDERGPT